MKKKSVLPVSLLCVCSSIAIAQHSLAPEMVVRNLYAAQKSRKTDPFFQTKSRARREKFFAKELADLIWNDAVSSARTNEVGQLSGDPRYNAQDMKITGFKIRRPMVGEGNLDLVEVPVTVRTLAEFRRSYFACNATSAAPGKLQRSFIPATKTMRHRHKDFVDESVRPELIHRHTHEKPVAVSKRPRPLIT